MRQITGTIVAQYSPAQGERIVTLYQAGNNPETAKARSRDDFEGAACFLKNLRLKTRISSLPEKDAPEFLLEDDDSTRLAKTIAFEWTGDRYEFAIYVSKEFGPWFKVGAVSLINVYGYSFRTYNLLDLVTDNLAQDFGIGDRIGYAIENVGKGLPSANDEIAIFGSWVEEIYAAPATAIGGSGMDLEALERLLAVESLNTSQNSRLNAIEALNTSQQSAIEAIQTLNASQDSRLSAVETLNTSQQSAIAKILNLICPVGSMMWWDKSNAGVLLPQNWAECNGQIINDPDSPYHGKAVPNINGEGLFIRSTRGLAGSDSRQTGYREEDAMQGHWHEAVRLSGNFYSNSPAATSAWGQRSTGNAYEATTLVGASKAITDGTNGTPRVANETRPKSITEVKIILIKPYTT